MGGGGAYVGSPLGGLPSPPLMWPGPSYPPLGQFLGMLPLWNYYVTTQINYCTTIYEKNKLSRFIQLKLISIITSNYPCQLNCKL